MGRLVLFLQHSGHKMLRKRMIRSIERVDVPSTFTTLVGPTIYLSTLLAGVCIEIVTDCNREDARGWTHLTVLVLAATFCYFYGSLRVVTASGVVTTCDYLVTFAELLG